MRILTLTTKKVPYLGNVNFLEFEVVENVGHGLQSDELASTNILLSLIHNEYN